MSVSSPPYTDKNPPKFKRCDVRLMPDSDGFGFALNPRNKPKFSIYSVETNSPAYRANLRANDVIVQVNKQNIRRLKFEKVRQMIKEASEKGQIEILAIDQDGYLYHKQRRRRFSSKRLVTPENTDYFSTSYESNAQVPTSPG